MTCEREHAPNEIPWTVYLFKSGDLYKIGISCDVRRRLCDLRHMSAVPVKHVVHAVVCCSDKARKIERGLHKRYEYHRRHGEWFRLDDINSGSIVTYLKSTSIDMRRRRRARLRGQRRDERTIAHREAALAEHT